MLPMKSPLSFIERPSDLLLIPWDATEHEGQPLNVRSVPSTQGGNWVTATMPYTAAEVLEQTKKRSRKRKPVDVKRKQQRGKRAGCYVPLDITIRSIADKMDQGRRSRDVTNATHCEAPKTPILPNADEEMTTMPILPDVTTPALASEPHGSAVGCSVRTPTNVFKLVHWPSIDDHGNVLAPDTPESEYGMSYRTRQLKCKLF